MRCPVGLRVARRREGQVTLVQELPFLTLGNDVSDESGRTGKIARVAVSIDHGVPKLVIELAYDAAVTDDRTPGPPRAKAEDVRSGRERDQTIGYDERPTVPALPRHMGLRRDQTNRELTLTFRTATPTAMLALAPRPRPEPHRLLDLVLARVTVFLAMLAELVSPRTT